MREEIEAAALFITRLVDKNISAACSSASSTHSTSSASSTSSSSSTSSESPPGFDEQSILLGPNSQHNVGPSSDQDKVEQFRQCLMKALYERFHNHWFPEQPAKGQAYRCIRLNECDRHDVTLQQACLQCGIDYKDLQFPVELTLWVDPDEVTCRFGENKGSHCLVAKFKDGEPRSNNLNIDMSNINLEMFQQMTAEQMRQPSLQGSPDYIKHNDQNASPNSNSIDNINNNNNNTINQNNGYQFVHQENQHLHSQQNHLHHQSPQIHLNHHHQKASIFPSYPNNYLHDNPIYYYF